MSFIRCFLRGSARSYGVLALSAVFDFYSWRISYREILARKQQDESTFDQIIGSKDPTVFTVFLEDSAGLAGVFIAFLGIFLGHAFRNPYFDPAASLLIALLLAAVAIFLGRETGALLAGERTNRSRIKKITEIVTADPAVERIGELLTMQLGPEEALVTIRLQFRSGIESRQLERIIARLKLHIQQQDATITRIFIEPSAYSEEQQDTKAA